MEKRSNASAVKKNRSHSRRGRKWLLHAACAAWKRGEEENKVKKEIKGGDLWSFTLPVIIKTSPRNKSSHYF